MRHCVRGPAGRFYHMATHSSAVMQYMVSHRTMRKMTQRPIGASQGSRLTASIAVPLRSSSTFSWLL